MRMAGVVVTLGLTACGGGNGGGPDATGADLIHITFDGDGFADGDSVIQLEPAGRVGIRGVRAAPDGALVLFGWANLSTGYDAQAGRELDVYLRLRADGRPDPHFGEGGIVLLEDDIGIRDLLVRPDGRLVAIGDRNIASNQRATAIWQLDVDGRPDPSFANGDAAVLDVSDLAGEPVSTYVLGEALAADGSLIAIGFPGALLPPFVSSNLAARVSPSGVVEERVLVPSMQNGHGDNWMGVTVDAQGTPRVYGEAYLGPSSASCMAGQLTAALDPDTSFSNGDYARIAPVASVCNRPVVRLPDGRVTADGSVVFDRAGDLDTSFGGDGQIALPDYANDVAGLADGTLLAQMQPSLEQSPFKPIYVLRIGADGAIDPAFGHSTGVGVIASGIAVTTTGKAYSAESELDIGVVHVRALPVP